MIRSIKVELNAAFPNMPLLPFHVFHGSAAAITVLNVPRRILSVAVRVVNVAGESGVFSAQRSGSAWTATIPGEFLSQPGTSGRGVKVEGVDELGNVFTLGVGDLIVLQDDGTIIPVSPPTTDDTVTRDSPRPVKSSGIWASIWGALTELPAGFASIYDWVTARLLDKADKSDLEGFATEADLLAFYYPDGNVTSMGQITASEIEYAVGDDGGAYVAGGEGLSGHVVLPWKVTIEGNEYRVTAIGENAFSGFMHSNSITDLTAPTTVKSIGNSAFENCHPLTTVNLPSVTSIGAYAFLNCNSLTTANLPSATGIGNSAFGYCDSITTANLPSATGIGDEAFRECSSLTTVDFGPSPKSSVPSLSSLAFRGVPTSCKFIIPLGMYEEWVAASGWSDLYAAGYEFEGYASAEQLANKADKASTLAGYGITDAATMASLAPEYSPASAYAVGEFVWHDGNIYQCKTAIADGGESWNPAHWELMKLSDFFTESNSLLTGTIDDRLPIPISAKSAGFKTESYKRFIVTVSGDMTVTLHTPTRGDAEIFECRFNGTSLEADASITFAGATATTMDANCGTVTAGKVALMSAFWNDTTWDVNWKVEG